jgi:FLVCR family MFS transporter
MEHKQPQDRKLYWQRWWLVAVFSLLGVCQSASWNFYSPISGPVKSVYGWSDYLIGWMANTAGIVFFLTVSAWSMVIDSRGPRFTTVASASLLFCCSALRCFPVPNDQHQYYVISSMVLNGLSAPPVALAPPIISAAWFPVHERTTATAIMTTMNYFGSSIGFLLGPLFVHAHDPTPAQASSIKTVYYLEAGVGLAVLLAVLAYFPSKPPTPPTASAALPKTDFLVGFKQLLRHKRGWVLFLAMGVPSGVYSGWGVVLDINLGNIGSGSGTVGNGTSSAGGGGRLVSQADASLIGFWSLAAGCVAGVLNGALADRFAGRMKRMIVALYAGAAACFAWFALLCSGAVPFSLWAAYLSCILGGFCINGTIPLFYELAVETTFPIAEGSTAGFLVLVQNLLQTLFLVVPTGGGTKWMNWVLASTIPLFAVAMLPFDERYARQDVDRGLMGAGAGETGAEAREGSAGEPLLTGDGGRRT